MSHEPWGLMVTVLGHEAVGALVDAVDHPPRPIPSDPLINSTKFAGERTSGVRRGGARSGRLLDMRPMDSRDVEQAVSEMVRVLTPHESADWRRRAGALDWSCWETAAHVAHDLLAYAGQLAARPDNAYLPFDLVVRDDASPHDLLQIVTGAGWLLSNALAVADHTIRAWHWGPTDPSGFAALGVNEILVHTHDITEGLGIRWHPPEPLCGAVLARLFPDAPAGDPVQVLLWSTGRTELPGYPRLTSWVLRAAVG